MAPRPDARAAPAASTVDERLEGLGQLYRLGISLQAAQGPAISRELFERRSLRLEGLWPQREPAPRVGGSPGGPAGVQDIWVACGSAGTRHEVGREYDLLLPADGSAPVLVRCVLVGVELPGGQRCDALPAGRRAACGLRFLGEVPALVRSLARAAEPNAGAHVWLGMEADWRKLRT